MEIIVIMILNIIGLFVNFGTFKITVDILAILGFFVLYFIFVYKKYYLHTRKRLIVFSAFFGIFLGELHIKGLIVLKKGTVESMLVLVFIILMIIFALEILDMKKSKDKLISKRHE